jgi:DNA primase
MDTLLDLIPTKLKRVGKEHHGACPFCGGTDRFYVKADDTWGCRRCGRSGDAITILMQLHGMGYFDACERLGVEPDSKYKKQNGEQHSQQTLDFSNVPNINNINLPEAKAESLLNAEWQDKAASFVDWSWRNLMNGDYPQSNKYLASRGIDEYTADIWMLGYNPQDWKRTWGDVEVFIPQGIVIPWMDEQENVMKINIRRYKKHPKYLQIKGGANWLFNSHRVHNDSIVVMVEGEIDAISIKVAFCDYRVVPVATGSTTGARWLRWAALLATANKVLIAFDDDDAGEKASSWWVQYLGNATRLIPEGHDVNDMLIKGISIPDWIMSVFPSEKTSHVVPKQKTMRGFLGESKSHYQQGY